MSRLFSIYSLWSREIKRFYRQRSRVVGALASPLVFWIFIGCGIGSSFNATNTGDEVGYLEYFYPGTILLILLFTSIFSTISLIEDRKEGFLQAVLVSPIRRFDLVMGKVLGGATLAAMQGGCFLLMAPLLGFHLSVFSWILVLLIVFLNSLAMTALGFILAWKMNSVQGFHAIMNLVLMPMWLLSGSLFPSDNSPQWLELAIKLNPISYGLAALRNVLYEGRNVSFNLPSMGLSLSIMFVFIVVVLWLAVVMASKRSYKDLPA